MNKHISLVAQASCLCIIGATLSIVTPSPSLAGNGCKKCGRDAISSQLLFDQRTWTSPVPTFDEDNVLSPKEALSDVAGHKGGRFGWSTSCVRMITWEYNDIEGYISDTTCTSWCNSLGLEFDHVLHGNNGPPIYTIVCEGYTVGTNVANQSGVWSACYCKEVVGVSERQSLSCPSPCFSFEKITPNPCYVGRVSVAFILPEKVNVRLELCDSSGRLLGTLVNEEMTKGKHTIQWSGVLSNGQYLSQGIYFLKLVAGKDSVVKKLVVLK